MCLGSIDAANNGLRGKHLRQRTEIFDKQEIYNEMEFEEMYL
jgi:hypothetical protein